MGSSALPMVGMGGYGNPTGVAPTAGLNPNFEQETFKKLQSFSINPQAKAVPFGGTGTTPFTSPFNSPNPLAMPSALTTPAATPTTTPTVPATPALPGKGTDQGGSTDLAGSTPVPGAATPTGLYGYNNAPTGTASLDVTGLTAGLDNWDLTRGLARSYGGNMALGKTLASILGNGAGWNPDVAKAMMNDIEPYFQENMANIMEAFGQAGNRYSSTSALAAGKFGADFTSHQQALYAQMYQTAVQNYLQIITGGKFAAQNTGSNAMGIANGAMSLLSTGAGALTAAGVGAGGGTMGAVLAGLAAL